MKRIKCLKDYEKCKDCGFCLTVNVCHSIEECSGCLSCYYACPYEARLLINEDIEPLEFIKVYINDNEYEVPRGITIKRALEYIGFKIGIYPHEGILQTPCNTGGCWTCAVLVNDTLERACITPVREGMRVNTDVTRKEPLRIVHGPEPHSVGGKATPWNEKKRHGFVEVAIWVAGCNLRCPQCQNFHVTYDNVTKPMTPSEAARIVTYYRRLYDVRGIAISGGEPTLNKRWLISYFRELKKLNREEETRLHLDSNGTLLTPDYIDELVEAGCNNIGIEPKAVNVETYMHITGLKDRDLAKRYLETSWNAIKYIVDNYAEKVYLGVGLIYNSKLISIDEIVKTGEKIASIDPEIQVCVLDYFPAFRRKDLKRPNFREMITVKRLLNEVGLKCVIVQTSIGHIEP